MYSQTPGLGRTANATHGGRTMASYILPKMKKVQQNQHQTNKTILKLAQAKTECDLLFCVTVNQPERLSKLHRRAHPKVSSC